MGNCFMHGSSSRLSGERRQLKEGDQGNLPNSAEKVSGEIFSSSESQKQAVKDDESSNISSSILGFSVREFTLDELKKATSDFSPYNLLGEGGFGHVFKGRIDGCFVAIKKLNAKGCQGHKEWLTEVEALGKLHHRNLVQLIGICFEHDQRILVYEYVPLGSLEDLLTDEECGELTWDRRVKIVLGIAEGLVYLHSQEPPIIHRDLKPSNILIDPNFNAKLCDFGLARDGPTAASSHVSTRVMGTHAYVDPEYYKTGKLRLGSDVYGFGVVLLQILTGRKALMVNEGGHTRTLVDWARPWLRDRRGDKFLEIMDPRLEEYPAESATLAGSLADCCTAELRVRPKADQIVRILNMIAGRNRISRHSHQRDD